MATDHQRTFLRSEVPKFLRKSDFFLSLEDGEDEPISIPSDCAEFSLSLSPSKLEKDLRNLLTTFRFWGVIELLHIVEFTTFVLTVPDNRICCEVLAEFENELSELSILRKILEEPNEEGALCVAISSGEFQLVQILAENNYAFSQPCLIAAAHHNQVNCLELALSKGCTWNPCVLNIAAKEGHVEVLKFAIEKNLELGENVCADAASAGHLSCLQYAYENGYKWPHKVCPVNNLPIALYARSIGAVWANFSCCDAAKVGCVDVLKYLHEGQDYDYPISNKALLVAVWMGNTDCVRCMRYIGVAWTGCECELAAYRGHLDTLKYLLECGCPCGPLTCWVCSVHDQVECLQYLHENGCQWDYTTPTNCKHRRDFRMRACSFCEEAYVLSLSFIEGAYTGVIDKIERLGEFWYRRSVGMPHIRTQERITPDLLTVHRLHDKSATFGIAALCSYYNATRCLHYARSEGCA